MTVVSIIHFTNCEHMFGALSLPGEESTKRQYSPFIPQMNVNSATAAYLHVTYACRQPKIRTLRPCMNQPMFP